MKGTEKVQGPTRGNGKKMADVTDPVSRPQDWDKVLLAAHLWLTLTTQKEAAKGAGIGERSLQRWITCRWWKQACSEVEGQWTNTRQSNVVEEDEHPQCTGVPPFQ